MLSFCFDLVLSATKRGSASSNGCGGLLPKAWWRRLEGFKGEPQIIRIERVKGDRSSQDNAAHPPPDYSSCLPPRKGAIRRDATYGRTIRRLTDSTKPGPGKAQSMTAEYATQNHFNADETAIFVTYSGHD